jgi:hypothetical protein
MKNDGLVWKTCLCLVSTSFELVRSCEFPGATFNIGELASAESWGPLPLACMVLEFTARADYWTGRAVDNSREHK